MILNVKHVLLKKDVKKENIHFELFNTSKETKQKAMSDKVTEFSEESKLTVILDGLKTEFNYNDSTASILDFAINKGLDLPFSCKGGVCCTCRAKIIEGEVEMRINYALTDDEVEDGFVLTCQSFPKTSNIIVDFDEN